MAIENADDSASFGMQIMNAYAPIAAVARQEPAGTARTPQGRCLVADHITREPTWLCLVSSCATSNIGTWVQRLWAFTNELVKLSGSLNVCQFILRESTWTAYSIQWSCTTHFTEPRRWLMVSCGWTGMEYRRLSFRRRKNTEIVQRSFEGRHTQQGWPTSPDAPIPNMLAVSTYDTKAVHILILSTVTVLNLRTSIVFDVKVIYHLWVSWANSLCFPISHRVRFIAALGNAVGVGAGS